MKAFVLTNPYVPICTPPVLMVLQFVTFFMLMDEGLPYFFRKDSVPSSLLLVVFFSLCAVSVPAMLIAIRQLFLGANKILSGLGLLFNAGYLLGFGAFFILIFLTQSLT